jgi:hypothetical protein
MTLSFKVYRPEKLDAAVFKDAFMDAAKEMASEVEQDFQAALDEAEFRHVVPFEQSVTSSGSTVKIEVKTNDLGFKYYDKKSFYTGLTSLVKTCLENSCMAIPGALL